MSEDQLQIRLRRDFEVERPEFLPLELESVHTSPLLSPYHWQSLDSPGASGTSLQHSTRQAVCSRVLAEEVGEEVEEAEEHQQRRAARPLSLCGHPHYSLNTRLP